MQKNKIQIGILIGLIILNFFLISIGGIDKGKISFFSIPIMFLINLIIIIYAIIRKNQKLALTALFLFFVAPVIAYVVFAYNFPFLTR